MARITRRRWLLRGAGLVGVAVAVVFGIALSAILRPTTGKPSRVDAVVVLGGAGDRLETAWDLMDRGTAPVLVISRGEYVGWPQEDPDPLCDQDRLYEVLCFEPEPETTRGEARAIGRLAQQQGWQEVAVVTSGYHITRAATLIRQCTDTQVTMVAAPSARSVRSVLREVLGLGAAVTVARAC